MIGTCKRTIREKGGFVHTQRKCGKAATHKQADGLLLCEHHYNKWIAKTNKAKGGK
jgi:hypothetical protein